MLGQTDTQTDGRTPCRYIDPDPHNMRTVPTNTYRASVSAVFSATDTFIRLFV